MQPRALFDYWNMNAQLIPELTQQYPTTFVGKYPDGKERVITDISANYWTNVVGFKNPKIVQTTLEAITSDTPESIVAFDITYNEKERLARRLARISGLGNGARVMGNCTGAGAVEYAFRVVWQYHQLQKEKDKKKIVAVKRGYHGATTMALAAGYYDITGRGNVNNTYLPDQIKELFVHLPSPNELGSLAEHLESILQEHNDIAGIIIEPVQGAGATTPRVNYYDGVNELLKEHNVKLIIDEIATAFRFGTWTASEYFGLQPDIILLGKPLTNGIIPSTATIISRELYEGLETSNLQVGDANRLFGPTLAFTPLAVTISNTLLDIIENDNLLQEGFNRTKEVKGILQEGLDLVPIDIVGEGGFIRLAFEDSLQAARTSLRLRQRFGYNTNTTINSIYVATPLVESEIDFEELSKNVKTCFESL